MSQYNPQQLQQKFERWSELHQEQLQAQQRFKEAEALYTELQAYYQSPQWMADHEAELQLQYSGSAHSIFSEDALWNMISDRNEVAIQWMRLGLDALDNK